MIPVVSEISVSVEGYDGIILVSPKIDALSNTLSIFIDPLKSQYEIDNSIETDGSCIRINLPAGRLIYAPTGPTNRDHDDVRRFYDAACSGVERALKACVRRPLLVVQPVMQYPHCALVALLGCLHKLYVPLEIREDVPTKQIKMDSLGFLGDSQVIKLALALEKGRTVARDIGGTDPERMAPPRVEEYIKSSFINSGVNIEVISNEDVLQKEYPLFSAVNRCAKGVNRHKGRIIYLTYEGQGPIRKTLLVVGKGVTYDTGGADIKAGGVMAGMHRDKCGAAAVAGLFQTIAELKPPHLKVIGGLSVVRNSVGSDCYVADEIITSRAGVRVRVRNTDAEGRMAMADVLCFMKEKAMKEVDPHLMTIATLTGHCCLAVGDYTAIMDNGPAHELHFARSVQDIAETIADPFEVSTIRREDYEFNESKCEYEDIVQSNCLPSSQTARGHQVPAAFLIYASGLDKHGRDSSKPLKYSHLDIAGSAGDYPDPPTGASILTLTKVFHPEAFQGI